MIDAIRVEGVSIRLVASESNESCRLRAGRVGKIEGVRCVSHTTKSTAMRWMLRRRWHRQPSSYVRILRMECAIERIG
jgi:hypothetical protein